MPETLSREEVDMVQPYLSNVFRLLVERAE
jgi:hypothetical protein